MNLLEKHDCSDSFTTDVLDQSCQKRSFFSMSKNVVGLLLARPVAR